MRKMFSEKQIESMILESKKNISTLVDNAGNVRFLEGDIKDGEVSGVTITYGKWSLSGTHLLIVLAGTIANATALSSAEVGSLTLPSWIMDKIYPLVGTRVVYNTYPAYGSDFAQQQIGVSLNKSTDSLKLIASGPTMTADRTFRFNFDLLID